MLFWKAAPRGGFVVCKNVAQANRCSSYMRPVADKTSERAQNCLLSENLFLFLYWKKIPLGRVYFWLTKRARGHSSAKYIFARFARCILVCFQKYICGWPGMQWGWTNIAGKIGVFHNARPRLQRTPDDHSAQKTWCSRLENRPHRFFVRFFYQNFSQVFRQSCQHFTTDQAWELQRSYIGVHRLWEVRWPCSRGRSMRFACLAACSKTKRGRKSKAGPKNPESTRRWPHVLALLVLNWAHAPVKQPVWSEPSMGEKHCTANTANTR